MQCHKSVLPRATSVCSVQHHLIIIVTLTVTSAWPWQPDGQALHQAVHVPSCEHSRIRKWFSASTSLESLHLMGKRG